MNMTLFNLTLLRTFPAGFSCCGVGMQQTMYPVGAGGRSIRTAVHPVYASGSQTDRSYQHAQNPAWRYNERAMNEVKISRAAPADAYPRGSSHASDRRLNLQMQTSSREISLSWPCSALQIINARYQCRSS